MKGATPSLCLEQEDLLSIQALLEINPNGVEHGHTRASRSRADR
jgi:hypothetical protein